MGTWQLSFPFPSQNPELTTLRPFRTSTHNCRDSSKPWMLQAAGAWSRHCVRSCLVCTVGTKTAVSTEASRMAALVNAGSARQLVAAEMFGCRQRSGLPGSAGTGSSGIRCPAPSGTDQPGCDAGHTQWPAANITVSCSQNHHALTVSRESRRAGVQPDRQLASRRLAATATFSTASRDRGASSGLAEEADSTAAKPSVRKVPSASAEIAAQAATARTLGDSPEDATEDVQSDRSFAQALPKEGEQKPAHSVAINFVSDGVLTTAAPGDNLWTVAEKCAFLNNAAHRPARDACTHTLRRRVQNLNSCSYPPCQARAPAQKDQVMKPTRPPRSQRGWWVASLFRCGVSIPLSCGRGDCGTCEMEVRKWDLAGDQGGTAVVRTCIAAVPPGYTRLEVDAMEDAIWGADGFDM